MSEEQAEARPTTKVNVRLFDDDIERLKEAARDRGEHWHTFLRTCVHRWLNREEDDLLAGRDALPRPRIVE